MTKAFTFYADPAHAWLKVAPQDLAALGLEAGDFSAYSYVNADRTAIYLEEDCDATKFIEAFRAKHGSLPAFKDRHCNGESHIRRMSRNVPKVEV